MTSNELYMLDVMNQLDLEFVEAADRQERPSGIAILKYAAIVAAVISILIVGMLIFPLIKKELPQADDPPSRTTSQQEVQSVLFALDLGEDVECEMTIEVKDGVVTAVRSTDPTVTVPVEESELCALSLQDAVKKLVGVAVEQRYIRTETDLAEVIGCAEEGSVLRRVFFEWTVEIAENMLEERYVTACRGARPPLSDETAQEIAAFYGVEKKSVQYLMNLFKYTNSMIIEDRAEELVHEAVRVKMYSVAYPPKYQVGDYDEYGEQVLYVNLYEDMPPFRIPLEDYPAFYQENKRKYYTEEDLAILYGPTVWTTVPNVLAQSEKKVVALLHQRNIAVRINYTDTYQIAGVDYTLEYGIGDCIMQDYQSGTRIRSDRGLTIWVYHPKKAALQKEALAEK